MKLNRALLGIVAIVAGVVVFLLVKKTSPNSSPPPAASSAPSANSTPSPSAPPQVPMPIAPVTIEPAQVHPVPGRALDVATVALEAKMITNAEQLLADGKPREALKQIDDYEHIPDRAALVPEARFVKIEALTKAGGHRTEALALAMSTRTEPEMADYQGRIDALLTDAGLISTPAPPPVP